MHILYKFYFVIIALNYFIINNVSAQITDVCGTDSVILKIDNYHYGTVHWERAMTIGQWESIPNAHDYEYKFLPKENMFYRAVVKFPDCPPVYSSISYVQMPPVANAGFDRVVSGNQLNLYANTEHGASGSWTILEGDGGDFSSENNPYATFYGADSLYVLEWKLTNACGVSRDTIEIRFRELVFRENLAIVDTTDIILSTNAELANGIYKINFSEPVPEIIESTILIGIDKGGYLRKVDSYHSEGNIYTLYTSPATLEDVIEEGAIDLAQVLEFETMSESAKSIGNFHRLDGMPTRLDLMTKSKFRSGQNFFYKISEEQSFLQDDTELKFHKSKEGATVISIDLSYPNIIEYGPLTAGIVGNYSLQPNLSADFDYGYYSGVKYARIGASNAIEDKYFGININLDAEFSANREFEILSVTKSYIILLGWVPVLVSVNLTFDGEISAEATAKGDFDYGLNQKNYINAYIGYENNSWGFGYNRSGETSVVNNFVFDGTFEQNFKIGPTLSFTVYKVLGPYIDFELHQQLEACINQDLDWQAEFDVSTELTIGASAEIFGYELWENSRSWPRRLYNLVFPHSIDIFLGNNQTYILGESLEFNPIVQLKNSRGGGLPLGKVMFSPKNGGYVSDSIVISDAAGYAEVVWVPGDSIMSRLEVFAYDCEGNHLKNSPLIFLAYADTTDICAESSLYVSVMENDSTISPVAHLGVPPYQYSTDGVNFSDTVPEIVYEYEILYTFTVIDEEECIAEITYIVPDPCENSDLAINIVRTGDEISVEPVNGVPPYMYSTDGSTYSPEIPVIISEPASSYTFYIKDDLGCIVSGIYSEPDLCEALGLSLDILVETDTVSMIAYGGTPPYLYSVDGQEFFEEIPIVIIESSQAFSFYVRDAINCQVSKLFDPCIEYGFNINLETFGDTVSVIADGGFPPYWYSLNYEAYVEEVPYFVPEHAMDYVFNVMDSIGCNLELVYNVCDEAGLSLNIVILDDEIIAQVEGGSPPYLYAINDTLSFSEYNSFFAGSGYHTIFVKDDIGCVVSQEVLKIECSEDGIIIGNQCWMAENLNLEVGSSYCYDDDPVNCEIFGRLYNYSTAMNACPPGWHLPTEGEWVQLRNYLVNNKIVPYLDHPCEYNLPHRIAKSLASQNYWNYSDCWGMNQKCPESDMEYIYLDCPCPGSEPHLNNASGFNALPGGIWLKDSGVEAYGGKGETANYWTTSGSTFSILGNLCLMGEDFAEPVIDQVDDARLYIRCIQNY